jgi:phosphate transport system ATP-binding protein
MLAPPSPCQKQYAYSNLSCGIRLHERLPKSALDARVEHCLRKTALWDEVRNKLGANGQSLQGGQQQGLYLARPPLWLSLAG